MKVGFTVYSTVDVLPSVSKAGCRIYCRITERMGSCIGTYRRIVAIVDNTI